MPPVFKWAKKTQKYLMARAAVTRYHKWGGLVQQKCFLSLSCRLGVCSQGLGRAGSSRRP